MLLKCIAVAGWATAAVVSGAHAQSLKGPKETPPSSFEGVQYVDSLGCVYLRAGIGGRVSWVARIRSDRKPLCGYPPTFGDTQVAATDVAKPAETMSVKAMAPATPTVMKTPSKGKPIETVASLRKPKATKSRAKPVARRAANPTRVAVYGCPASKPIAKRYQIRGGDSTVLCTSVDGGIENAVLPFSYEQVSSVTSGGTVLRGYKKAWKDGRLNPYRGKGTVAGQAAQDEVWTQETPAQLVADVKAQKAGKRRAVIRKSTSNAPPKTTAPRVANSRNGYYVQVGTFGVSANAQGTAARLSRMGLPVAASRINRNGRALQIVMAGPFAKADQAQAALQAARRAGFGDAFIR